MKKIWEFFENLNEFVYVADADTHELVYMNKKTREKYGFSSVEEIIGKKCYEVLQSNSTPCAICNNHELAEGQFKEWCYYNPILGKHLALKDTLIEDEGRRYRLEIAVDISTQERQGMVLRRYQDLEAIANEGFRIAMKESTPDKSIDVILEYLGKALQGERVYVFEHNASGGDDNTYEWVASGVMPQRDNLQDLSPEICANWYRYFDEEQNVIIEDLEEIREKDPIQYEVLKNQNIQSLVVVPLYDEGKVIGFYGVDNPPCEFLDYTQNMLQIVGHFISSCLKRRNYMEELRNLSYTDQLTGLGNRHAFYEYIRELPEGESTGVVYCDITGLKHVNDTQGHEAGDELIVQACECLKRVFSNVGLFRLGGDELVAICAQIGEGQLAEKTERLRADLYEHDVAMAIGADWGYDGRKNIDRFLSAAEKQMYEDKAQYYQEHGIDRRK